MRPAKSNSSRSSGLLKSGIARKCRTTNGSLAQGTKQKQSRKPRKHESTKARKVRVDSMVGWDCSQAPELRQLHGRKKRRTTVSCFRVFVFSLLLGGWVGTLTSNEQWQSG